MGVNRRMRAGRRRVGRAAGRRPGTRQRRPAAGKGRSRAGTRPRGRALAESRQRHWTSAAHTAGQRYAADHPVPPGERPEEFIQRMWESYWFSPEADSIQRGSYAEAAAAFAGGYLQTAGLVGLPVVLLPTRQTVGAVVTAMNEEHSLPFVLEQLRRLPLDETIIIVNGSHDRTFEAARACEGAIVLHYARPLGHDVGRAIGAKISNADIVLFLDGDFPIEAERLAEFVYAVESGTDVALNDISPYIGLFRERDGVTVAKEFLNRALGRSDLRTASLTAVPHALSRHAIRTIGCRELAVPPKAHALAIARGLRVAAPVSVDVVSRNRRRLTNTGEQNPVERLIVGDHIEALQAVMAEEGGRLGFRDTMRRRMAEGERP